MRNCQSNHAPIHHRQSIFSICLVEFGAIKLCQTTMCLWEKNVFQLESFLFFQKIFLRRLRSCVSLLLSCLLAKWFFGLFWIVSSFSYFFLLLKPISLFSENHYANFIGLSLRFHPSTSSLISPFVLVSVGVLFAILVHFFGGFLQDTLPSFWN